MKKSTLLLFSLLLLVASIGNSQTIESYKLDNGLTVILDSNPDKDFIYGSLVVNAGSKDEDPNATGVAHYLEHMLFKGTQSLGTSDYEKEKVYLDQIDELYDQLQTASEDEVKEIQAKINELTIQAGKYSIPNEFSALIQEMGGQGLNAGTSYDYTYYHNSFPANQIEKWLNLYAHRFEQPVFRLFQPELETVYEEKNRSADNIFTEYSNQLFVNLFKNHPYSRPIIGETEHLKKPNMSAMKEFFHTWYVPNNMALILSGNVDIEQTKPLIEAAFGGFDPKDLPARNNPSLSAFKGRQEEKVKLTSYLTGVLAFRGAQPWTDDDLALTMISSILTNNGNYGLLDELEIDGDVNSVGATNFAQKDAGAFLIEMVPVLDRNQGRQLSFKFTEKMIWEKLDQLKSGDFSDELLENAKQDFLRNNVLSLESPQGRVYMFMDGFINGKSTDEIAAYFQKVQQLTKDDIVQAANLYLGKDYLAYLSTKGKGDKDEIEKPELKPIEAIDHDPSEFAQFLTSIEVGQPEYHSIDFNSDVKTAEFQDKVQLHYVPNKVNNIFNMQLVFGTGKLDYPLLKFAVPIMNRAGIMGQLEANEVKTEFAKLGVNYSFRYDDNFTYVNLQGEEKNLSQAVGLLSKLLILPSIEDKAFDAIVSNEILSRLYSEKDNIGLKNAAVQEYLLYGDNSDYINRISSDDLWSLRPTELIAEFHKAISTEADIHYYGQYSFDDVQFVLKNSLSIPTDRTESSAPKTKEFQEYSDNQIYLVDDQDILQTQLYLFQKEKPLDMKQRAVVDGFNQYLGGSFNGLMMKEIREYRALAYTAAAGIGKPLLTDWDSYLFGYVGTQADKTNDVVDVLNTLFTDLPVYEERFPNVKSYLLNSTQMSTPNPRYLSQTVERWKLAGYEEDPNKVNLKYYEQLTFDDIYNYYTENIKGKPMAFAIMGNTRKIDSDKLKEFGKVNKLNVQTLFDENKASN